LVVTNMKRHHRKRQNARAFHDLSNKLSLVGETAEKIELYGYRTT